MRKLETLICGSLVAGVAAFSAQAGTFEDTFISGPINTWEDQSRESIVDVDGDGALSDGDVIIGFLSLDNRAVPGPGTALNTDSASIVFSQMVENFQDGPLVLPNGDVAAAAWDLVGTPTGHVTGLAINDLYKRVTGVDLPTMTSPGAPMALTIEDFGFDPLASTGGGNAAVGDFDAGQVDLTDIMMNIIAGGKLSEVSGIGTDAGDDDFFSSQASNASALSTLSLLDDIGLASGVAITFNGGLSVLFEDFDFHTKVEEAVPFPLSPGVFTFHDTTITNGDTTGAADISYTGVFGTRVTGAGNPFIPNNSENPMAFTHSFDGNDFIAYPVSNNADVSQVPLRDVIPEPATAGLGLIALGALAGATRRRRNA